MVDHLTAGHRVHLRSLARQEQAAAYKRDDYLTQEWQVGLWQDEVKGALRLESPKSATALVQGGGVVVPEAPSKICVGWREKITEWKYRLVDRFRKTSTYTFETRRIRCTAPLTSLRPSCSDLDRELVAISTFYLDKYLSTHYVDEEVRVRPGHGSNVCSNTDSRLSRLPYVRTHSSSSWSP